MGNGWSKLRRAATEMPIEFERYALLRYPSFVASPRPQPLRDEVPVLMYHSVEREPFAAQMEFLHRNGYQTLSLEQFVDFLCERLRLSGPAVLLTFDDGEKSLYEVAFPILKKYGFRAAVFVVTAYIRSEPDPAQGKGWLAWEHLAEMESSGLVEVHSHSHYHARIFCSPRLVDFHHPGFDPNPLGMDIPWTSVDGQLTNHLEWGAPIYRFSPNLAGRRRYIDPSDVRQACTEYVAAQGGAAFFQTESWRKRLHQVFQQAGHGKQAGPGKQAARYETGTEQTLRMEQDVQLAGTLIEERLGHPARHFCFPWGAGSEAALKICKQQGYASAFWVVSGHRRSNRPGDDPYTIQRLKDDYVLRLPGEGRQSLVDIYRAKLQRRRHTLDLY